MNKEPTYKVLCFCFAGGSRYSFHAIKKHLPDDLALITIDYPGRGYRMSEKFLYNMDDMVEDIYQQIKGEIDTPYMIFGHSMGGLIAYRIAVLLRTKNKNLPDSVFITGCRAPSTWDTKKKLHDLPFPELVTELKLMGGVPDEILEDRDYMNFFEPIIRADFSVVASHAYRKCEPLSIPFKIITGTDEDISVENGLKWQEETTFPLLYKQLKGKHFFIFDHPQIIAREMVDCYQIWKKNP